MCGIFGIIGHSSAVPFTLEALKKLEYRGYDSAGIVTIESGTLKRLRASGKLSNLEKLMNITPLSGSVALGHTRWATHGAPTEANAHPHFSHGVAVVHNGVIENFKILKDELLSDGYEFHSVTDTEIVAHLVSRALRRGASPVEASFDVFGRLQGAFALALMFEQDRDIIVGVSHGPPLVIGYANDFILLASDAVAFSGQAKMIAYLEDGDRFVLRPMDVSIYDASGCNVARKSRPVSANVLSVVDKGDYRHFMAKEIHEQPEVVSHTLSRYIDFTTDRVKPQTLPFSFSVIDRLLISACGTAFLSGLVAKHWFEHYARLPVDIDLASEFRYREPPLSKNSAALFISQSGETADTLAALRYCRKAGIPVTALVNVEESSIARESDSVLPVLAGPEIGVASTKSFTCQLAAMAALAILAGKNRGFISDDEEKNMVGHLAEIPRLMRQILKLEHRIEKIAGELTHHKHALYLGRGVNYPLALEGALKLKEISYIHAEGYAAGELKHGPMALVDENMPVIVVAPFDRVFDKTLSNIQEVSARGGKIILFTDSEGEKRCSVETLETVVLPLASEMILPLLYALPVQMLAYFTAVSIGTDVDQPRNLAKSVTVE